MELDDPALDRLLAARRPGPAAEDPLDDGLILAWRAGRLSPEASEALEARLARDPEARALAFALAEALPETTQARAEKAREKRALPIRPLLALAAALLLGVGLWFALQRPPTPGPAYTAGPLQGSVKQYMAHDAPETGRFVPESELVVVFRPAAPGSTPPVHVFADRGDAIVRVEAKIEPGEAGIVRIRVKALDAFQAAYGARRLLVALGPGEVPARLEGLPEDGLTWFTFPVTYLRAIEETP